MSEQIDTSADSTSVKGTEPPMKTIHQLDLHEWILLDEMRVIRVPGGWLYELRASTGTAVSTTAVFVPLSVEFEPQVKRKGKH